MLLRLLMGGDKTVACTAFERTGTAGSRLARADGLVFVREGFDVQAFFGGPIWLAAQKTWWTLGFYTAVLAVIAVLVALFDLEPTICIMAVVAMHIYIAFEADDFKRQALERDGFQSLGVVVGKNVVDCERRFLDLWLRQHGSSTTEASGVSKSGTSGSPGGGDRALLSSGPHEARVAPTGMIKPARPRVIGDLLGLGERLGGRGAGSRGRS